MTIAATTSDQPAPQRHVTSHSGLGTQLGLRDGDALLIIDVQRDFMPGGSLPVPDAQEIIAPLNAYITAFDALGLPIFLSRDWHPPRHCSFNSERGRWPPHCVRDTAGAQWAKGLIIVPQARIISKATERTSDAYSAFAGTSLLTLLRDLRVGRLFVGGLATDHCVHATVLDARAHGFDVVLLANAIRGINAQPGDETGAIEDMLEHGATLLQSSRAADALALPVPPTNPLPEHVIGNYGFGTTLTMSFAAALDRLSAALQTEGFGILTDVDVQAILRKNTGAEIAPYRILGACNPPLAQRALQADASIGLLLPCNVVVRQVSDTLVAVEFLDPNVLATLSESPAIGLLATEVRDKLVRVMARVAQLPAP